MYILTGKNIDLRLKFTKREEAEKKLLEWVEIDRKELGEDTTDEYYIIEESENVIYEKCKDCIHYHVCLAAHDGYRAPFVDPRFCCAFCDYRQFDDASKTNSIPKTKLTHKSKSYKVGVKVKGGRTWSIAVFDTDDAAYKCADAAAQIGADVYIEEIDCFTMTTTEEANK